MKINKHVQKLEYPKYEGRYSISINLDLSQHTGRDGETNYVLSQDKEVLEIIARTEILKKENILLTAGADAALHHIAETFLDKGEIAIIPVPSFGRFEFHTKVVGAKPFFVKHTQFPHSFDLERITKIAQEKKGELIFLANPNNPTGELISKKRLKKFIQSNAGSLIVIDEVLVEEEKDSVSEFVNTYKNLVVVKSFSKIFGIPGLRIGYILANPQLRNIIGKTVSPYEISSLSLHFLKRLLSKNKDLNNRKRELKQARDLLKKELPLSLSNTRASVGLIKTEKNNSLFEYLLKHGILTVDGRNFRGLEKTNMVRIIINSKKHIEKLIDIIKRYKSEDS